MASSGYLSQDEHALSGELEKEHGYVIPVDWDRGNSEASEDSRTEDVTMCYNNAPPLPTAYGSFPRHPPPIHFQSHTDPENHFPQSPSSVSPHPPPNITNPPLAETPSTIADPLQTDPLNNLPNSSSHLTADSEKGLSPDFDLTQIQYVSSKHVSECSQEHRSDSIPFQVDPKDLNSSLKHHSTPLSDQAQAHFGSPADGQVTQPVQPPNYESSWRGSSSCMSASTTEKQGSDVSAMTNGTNFCPSAQAEPQEKDERLGPQLEEDVKDDETDSWDGPAGPLNVGCGDVANSSADKHSDAQKGSTGKKVEVRRLLARAPHRKPELRARDPNKPMDAVKRSNGPLRQAEARPDKRKPKGGNTRGPSQFLEIPDTFPRTASVASYQTSRPLAVAEPPDEKPAEQGNQTTFEKGATQSSLLELMTKGLGTFTEQMADMVIGRLRPEYEVLARRVGSEVRDATVEELRELRTKVDTTEKLLLNCKKDTDLLQKKLEREKTKYLKELEEKNAKVRQLEVDVEKEKLGLTESRKAVKRAESKAKAEEQKRLKGETESADKLKELQQQLDKAKGEILQQKALRRVAVSNQQEQDSSFSSGRSRLMKPNCNRKFRY